MDELNSLLLTLYRAAHEVPFEDFQERAFRLLRGAIPFDLGRWGTGAVDSHGLVFHEPYLYDDSPDSLKDYTQVREFDDVAFNCMKNPGRTVNCYLPEHCTRSTELRAYAHRYRHEHGLVTGVVDPSSGHVASISLYGAYERKPFSEGQRALMQTVFPHLGEALAVSQRLQAERIRKTDSTGRWGVAVSDSGGLLSLVEPAFIHSMQLEWPGSSEVALPGPLFRWLIENPHQPFCGRKIVVVSSCMKGLLFLKARGREAIDNLTQREREVAELVASGLTHKEVAKALKIAPSTVNNHLRTIHERVGARNNADLAAQLRGTQT